MPRNIKIVDGTIAVTGGVGEAYALINYPHTINVLRLVCINAPSESATFDFLVRDAGGYLLYKEAGFTGDTSIAVSVFANTKILIRFENVSVDGDYAYRLYLEN